MNLTINWKLMSWETSREDSGENRMKMANNQGKKNVLTAPFTGSAPQESLMVFCGVNEKHFDKILFELRRKQIPVDYKAVLTPSNRKWSVLMLMLELTKEKNSFRQGN